ncbi:hypothetical protein M0813_16170 [Anaeramoeba flamelloides]|uniref:Uncharacterized protein n=1 Tax=Anaeramoeba flamelloides TaxID=1746091 RepID=A0ABQ8Z0B0_9EUKA|nr:hypothetical protein M0813_16170 [Anaeramoeba flamelloides]
MLPKISPTDVQNFKGSEILTEKKAVQLATGRIRTLVLTDQNELYVWGFDDSLFPTNESNKNRIYQQKSAFLVILPNIWNQKT